MGNVRLGRPPSNSENDGVMMDCKICASTPEGQLCGVYDFNCVACCARLVASARPSRARQEGMLAAIAKFKKSPKRDEILEFLKNKARITQDNAV